MLLQINVYVIGSVVKCHVHITQKHSHLHTLYTPLTVARAQQASQGMCTLCTVYKGKILK